MKSRNEVVEEMANLLRVFKGNHTHKIDAIKFLKESFPGTSLTLRVNAYEVVYN